VVPGFPMTILDSEAVGMHVQGHVLSVTHNFGARDATTSVQFSFGRTLNQVLVGAVADGGGLDTFPQDPVAEIQDSLQYIPTANLVYSILFRRNEISERAENGTETIRSIPIDSKFEELCPSPGVFDHRLVLQWGGFYNHYGRRLALTRKLTPREEQLPAFSDYAADQIAPVEEHKPLVPKTEAKELFSDHDAAMRYVARPVCPLEHYIDFYRVAGRGKSNLDPLGRGRGVRIGAIEEAGVPTYYSVIRQFVGGPGVEPGSELASPLTLSVIDADEDGGATDAVFSKLNVGYIANYADLPDSRRDWQRLLLEYVQAVLRPTALTGDDDGDV